MSVRSLAIVLSVALCLAVAGCQNPGTGGNQGGSQGAGNSAQPGPLKPVEPIAAVIIAPSPQVDHIELEASPSAVNLDSEPGPDGVMLKVRLYTLKQPLAFMLERGEIEFLLFEGNVKEHELSTTPPLNTWRIGAAQMRPFAGKVAVGTQYVLTLTWLERAPSTSTITVVARLLRPSAPPLYASRVVLTTGPR
ncbi:MAG: hypothetical protein WD768_21790 [Phycisphaeraceae bacterium]